VIWKRQYLSYNAETTVDPCYLGIHGVHVRVAPGVLMRQADNFNKGGLIMGLSSRGEEKQSAIENIIDLLRPNTYADENPNWQVLEKGLKKMSKAELSTLWTLLTCVRREILPFQGGE